MVDMLGPVSTWEDRGVERSGTLPSDWYTSPRALRPRAAHAVPRGLALRRPRRPGAEPGPVLHVRGGRRAGRRGARPRRRAARDVQRLPAPRRAGGGRLRQPQGLPVPVPRLDVRAGRPGPAHAGDGRHRATSSPARCACRSSRSASGGRRCGSRWSPPCRSTTWLADVTPRLANYGIGRDALRRRTPLGDRLQLEALRRQLHGGLPHPLHPPGPRPEPQPVGLHLPARALLERAVRRRAAPARPRLAGRRHPRRHAGAPRAEAAARRPRRVGAHGLLLPLGLPADHDQLHARRDPDLHDPAARARTHRVAVHVVVPGGALVPGPAAAGGAGELRPPRQHRGLRDLRAGAEGHALAGLPPGALRRRAGDVPPPFPPAADDGDAAAPGDVGRAARAACRQELGR